MMFLPPAKYPMIESWLFFGSPTPMLIIFAIYLSSVIIGSKIMKNRKPLKLQTLIRVYNLLQIVGCTYFSYIAHFKFGYNSLKSTWRCETNDMYLDTPDDIVQVFSLSWMFFWLRLIELIETIFFILRKKQKQVSVLHVYHHISTLVFLYLGSRYSAEVMDIYCVVINNDVHILMYIYYFLSSYKALQTWLLKLKPVLTTIQIIQLILILGQCVAEEFCGTSHLFRIGMFQITVLLMFFGNFYYQNYMKKKARLSDGWKDGKIE
ncbi:very long chain fatty acid elongase 7-like [Chironomus tepperi]|uniref:very long chain fatty acid elongase 7-like n=1 Tax=Chironomus tepperi TaxID=113505 RepID=UPI00391F5866